MDPAVAYQVRLLLASGVVQTTADPPNLTVTRGETFAHIDFGIHFRSGSSAAVHVNTVSGTGVGSADALLIGALQSTSGGTATSPSGTHLHHPASSDPNVSLQAVANAQLAVLRYGAVDSFSPVGTGWGVTNSFGSNVDTFWSVLAADFGDALA